MEPDVNQLQFATNRTPVAMLTVRLLIRYGEGPIKLFPIFGKSYEVSRSCGTKGIQGDWDG